MMRTSQKGINLIKEFEGCRLKAYKCPAGVWTIGYGHTSNVKPNQSITREEAERLLREDLRMYEHHVENTVKEVEVRTEVRLGRAKVTKRTERNTSHIWTELNSALAKAEGTAELH